MSRDSPILASAIDPLLGARSVRLYTHADLQGTAPRLRLNPPCRLGTSEPVDVALVALPSWRSGARLRARAARAAQTVVALIPPSAARGGGARGAERALLLGDRGSLQTPRFALEAADEGGALEQTEATASSPTPERGAALIAQDATMARLFGQRLAARSVPVVLNVGVGLPQHGYWRAWLQSVVRSAKIDAVLLALSTPPPPEWLAGLELDRAPALVLHILADRRAAVATQPGDSHPDRPPDATDAARSLGWTVADTLDCAVEALRLRLHGIEPQRGPVLALGETEQHQRVVAQALHQAGVATSLAQSDTQPVAAIVCAGHVARGDLPACLELTLTPPGTPSSPHDPLPASSATLQALAALLRTAPRPDAQARAQATVRSSDSAANARRVLADSVSISGTTGANLLNEVQLKAALAAFDIHSPNERLTTSASAAADAARNLGVPVALKAIGPALTARSRWGGVLLDVPTVAGARQAFRDVVHAARERFPAERLEGVLVSPMVPTPVTLDCAIHTLGPVQLLQVQLRCQAAYLGRRETRRCPLDPAEAEDLVDLLFAETARALVLPLSTPGSARKSERRALHAFLLRLSEAGSALAPQLRWLRLDTVALPSRERPPLVLDAAARQIRQS